MKCRTVGGAIRIGIVAAIMTFAGRAMRADAQAIVEHSDTTTVTEQEAPRWEISLGGQIGGPRGFVKVGEFDRSGTKLRLKQDLGIDTFEVADLGIAWHFTERDILRADFTGTFLYGSNSFESPIAYNGSLLAAGEVRTTTPMARVVGLYEHEFVHTDDGAIFAFGGGLTFVHLNFQLHGTLA